jgi:PhnB protein
LAITPYLLYRDAGAALTFLAAAFGFRQEGPAMQGEDGRVNHAAMRLGKHLIMLGSPGLDYQNPKDLNARTQSLYVDVDDADKMFARAVNAGAAVVEEPNDTFYGARRCAVEDPEGHQWYFAAALAKATRKQAVKKRGKQASKKTAKSSAKRPAKKSGKKKKNKKK